MSNSCATRPTENITRLSTLWSAATAQADPIAMPTSTVFKAQGTPGMWFFSSQVSNPQ